MGLIRTVSTSWGARVHDIADFQSRLLLTVFYFTLFVPFALVKRLFGPPLGLDRQGAGTSWRPGVSSSAGLESARRQF